MDRLLHLIDLCRQHSSTVALAVTWVGIALVYWRRRSDWEKKQFLGQVNFSLNYIINDALAMRTVLESTAPQVWVNEYGVKKVVAAAHKTTEANPFILLGEQADQDFLNRAVLNVLSERFAESFLAQALGVPAAHGSFCFAVTYERYVEIRTLKVRVLIIEENILARLFGPDQEASKLRIEGVYKTRARTLNAMYDVYVRDKKTEAKTLGYIEMGVPS